MTGLLCMQLHADPLNQLPLAVQHLLTGGDAKDMSKLGVLPMQHLTSALQVAQQKHFCPEL